MVTTLCVYVFTDFFNWSVKIVYLAGKTSKSIKTNPKRLIWLYLAKFLILDKFFCFLPKKREQHQIKVFLSACACFCARARLRALSTRGPGLVPRHLSAGRVQATHPALARPAVPGHLPQACLAPGQPPGHPPTRAPTSQMPTLTPPQPRVSHTPTQATHCCYYTVATKIPAY